MTADTLLGKLDRVKKTGTGRWIARCPAHDDGRPSLSIRELEDGRVLLHCFAQCCVADVLAAVGLDLGDLFPEPVGGYRGRRERYPFHAADVLRATAEEAQIAAIVAARLAYGYDVGWEEIDRLMVAAQRLARAATTAGVDANDQRYRERLRRRREHRAAA